jgi:hypothetical protein
VLVNEGKTRFGKTFCSCFDATSSVNLVLEAAEPVEEFGFARNSRPLADSSVISMDCGLSLSRVL